MSRTPEQTAQNTEYARRRRQRQLAEANAARLRCVAILARGKPCKTPLQNRLVNGETQPFCPTCDRKARGICIDCAKAPVDGTPRRSLRCALCQRLERQDACRRSKMLHADRVKRQEAKRMKDPVRKAKKLEYKKLYRLSKPKKIQAYKAADYQKHRERYLEYHRQYRARHREARASTEVERYHGRLVGRTCLTCPTVMTGRQKKCDTCRQQHKQFAIAQINARLEAMG